MAIPLAILRQKLLGQPLPPADSFAGKRVLITGGTAGLGLATAEQVIRMGASEVIITCRNAQRGEAARKRILAAAPGSSDVVVKVVELDMSKYDSAVAFVEGLKDFGHDGGFDFVCLNAGISDARWVQSPEGWAMTLQVNVLSTVLIGALLMPWLKTLRKDRKKPAHLTFVSSCLHTSPDISSWDKYATQGGILKHLTNEENFANVPLYSASKLMLEYAVQEISQDALASDGRPQVIVNTCCPGLVRTEINRSIKEVSYFQGLAESIVMPFVAQSVEHGSRTYLAAGLTAEEQHGNFITYLWNSDEYAKHSYDVIMGEKAREAQKLVWNEIKQELSKRVPAAKQVLEATPVE